ncbi:type I DNA topoisomerase [Mycoplasma sp. ATU-Cv-508]|uniref:type I DNA topoisomerase n=1 Tax=Mycoplasma sp. ATU-Cv-508 TaxID=2048001 RepID=UPI001F0066C3
MAIFLKLPSSGENNFGVEMETWTPRYKIDPEKRKYFQILVSEIKKLKPERIYLATDPDREGEAIASHLVEFLKISDRYYRIRFNEITKQAVLQAIKHPGKIDEPLVDSQTARRILDRVIGYKLSRLMRQKISRFPLAPSAGRVQSIALKLVVEREQEIDRFVPIKYFTLQAALKVGETVNYLSPEPAVTGDVFSVKPEMIETLMKTLSGQVEVVDKIERVKKDVQLTPLKQATLYKRADAQLGMSSKVAQRSAQRLYEGYGDGGLITYPRTDSTRMANYFVENAKLYITQKYGAQLVASGVKGFSGNQDAHEAIRPTDIRLTPEQATSRFELSSSESKLYQLIYEHTLQTLMRPPERQITRYELVDPVFKHKFRHSTSKVTFVGYLVVKPEKSDQVAPTWTIGQTFEVRDYQKKEHETKGPGRYKDGTLIEALDNIGVGRPSTFSSTVTILKDRHYVSVENRALRPTEFAKVVYDKLIHGFPRIMNESYTAEVEKELDMIADGKMDRKKLLDSFWSHFSDDLTNATSELAITELLPVLAGKDCPKCGSPLVVKTNRRTRERFFGCSRYPECKHAENDPSQAKKRWFSARKSSQTK